MVDKTGTETKKQRDFDDLQHEVSGSDNGRMKRFLGENRQSIEAKRKKQEAREAQSRLLMLLADPVYRAKYELVHQRLDELEQAAERALSSLENKIFEAKADLKGIQDKAARLPDGTHVYRDADGVVRREDGSEVDQTMIDTIIWSGNEPSYEAYQNANSVVSELEQQYAEVTDYRTDVLGTARNRIEDQDNPPSLNDLDDILKDIESTRPASLDGLGPAEDTAVPTTSMNLTIPDLGGKP